MRNRTKMSIEGQDKLDNILQQHEQLAIRYSMKEQLSCLFESRCFEKSLEDWQEWFDAAKASNIPALIRFATLKEKRIWGLASHALFPIHTGNNEIKVAKRIAYGCEISTISST